MIHDGVNECALVSTVMKEWVPNLMEQSETLITADITNTFKRTSSLKYVFIMLRLIRIRENFPLYMYLTSVHKFYNLNMAVRLKMCGLDTVNGALGMWWGFRPELKGSQFSIRYIKFVLSSWVKHSRCDADNMPPSTAEFKNEFNYTSTHFHTGV
jgi:hypothetical protein